MDYNELIKIPINGIEQWIYIRGKKKNNPVLLFLHGGPGFPGIAVSSAYQQKLENYFNVIQWDQRCAGKTFSETPLDQGLTINLYLSDLFQVLDYIKYRFGKEKVYLMGHSWGSLIGLLALKQAPQRFISYIGIGQFVNIRKNSELCYQYCLRKSKETNNNALIKSVVMLGIADDCEKWDLEHQHIALLGGSLYNHTDLEPLGKLFFTTELYTESEKQNIPKAMVYSCVQLFDEMAKINLMEDIRYVDVPVLFISGKYDYLSVTSLVQSYFDVLGAPKKSIELFEKSAHFPFIEEPDTFSAQVCEWFRE